MTMQRRRTCLVASLSLALFAATAGANPATLPFDKPVAGPVATTGRLVLAASAGPDWTWMRVERTARPNEGGPSWGLDSLTLSATPDPGAAGLALLALGSAAAAMRVSRRRETD